MIKYAKKTVSNTRGATAVETALVLPFVAIFLFGILQVSLIFYELTRTQSSLDDAARKILILTDPSDDLVRTTASTSIYRPNTASVVLTTTFINQYGGDFAKLEANFRYTVSIPFTNGITLNKNLGTEIALQR